MSDAMKTLVTVAGAIALCLLAVALPVIFFALGFGDGDPVDLFAEPGRFRGDWALSPSGSDPLPARGWDVWRAVWVDGSLVGPRGPEYTVAVGRHDAEAVVFPADATGRHPATLCFEGDPHHAIESLVGQGRVLVSIRTRRKVLDAWDELRLEFEEPPRTLVYNRWDPFD